MESLKQDFEQIETIVQSYFDGLYEGDSQKLRAQFHPDAFLKAPGIRRSLEQWLADVESRPKPVEQGQEKAFRILAMDVVKSQAMVKVSCPLFHYQYIDFLGLLKEDGNWLIVNKMYADIKN